MESTLARNLSDHRGNNLLHVVAGAGDADALAWLCSAFGPQMQDALLDENKRGLTPVVAAIQSGRLEVLQFLVEHTSVRQRLAPADGDRSLLHCAAKYGKVPRPFFLHSKVIKRRRRRRRRRTAGAPHCTIHRPSAFQTVIASRTPRNAKKRGKIIFILFFIF